MGRPLYVSTRPLIVSPGMEAADSQQLQQQLGAAGNIVNSYSDRYGWGGERDRLDRIRQNQYNRSGSRDVTVQSTGWNIVEI